MNGRPFKRREFLKSGVTLPVLPAIPSTTRAGQRTQTQQQWPPREISTIEQLQGIEQRLDGDYELVTDIDLQGQAFSPLGGAAHGGEFTGSFDGNGHTLSNVTIEQSGQTDVGLFGRADRATITDLQLENVDLTGDRNVGALVGWDTGSTIRRCSTTGSVSGESTVGGLVGRAEVGTDVRECFTDCTVSADSRAAGLVAFVLDDSPIHDSYSLSDVEADEEAAGLVGRIGEPRDGPLVRRVYAAGPVNSSDTVGGLIAHAPNSGQSVTANAYWDTTATGQADSDGGTPLTTPEMQGDAATTNMSGFDFTNTWETTSQYPQLRWETGDPVVSGEEATEIEDWHDLDAVRDDLDGEYVLVADLDSDTDGYDEHVGDPEGGWEPIGDSYVLADVEFTGTFDGNGNEIADLVFDRPDWRYVGLFGGNEGRIENVTIKDATVTGDAWVGGLVGINFGEIASSSAEGDVSGRELVGGLVGWNQGEIASSAAEGDVTGEEGFVGGLVGLNDSGAEIDSSYATGDVTGEDRVGGLVGRNSEFGENESEIESSFATGAVNGDSAVGGVVGENEETVTDTYWDVEATGQEDGIGEGQGDATGLDTDEMQGESATDTMSALDFEETWETTSGYPQLAWESDATVPVETDLELNAPTETVSPGSSVSVQFEIENQSNVALEDVTLELEEGWALSDSVDGPLPESWTVETVDEDEGSWDETDVSWEGDIRRDETRTPGLELSIDPRAAAQTHTADVFVRHDGDIIASDTSTLAVDYDLDENELRVVDTDSLGVANATVEVFGQGNYERETGGHDFPDDVLQPEARRIASRSTGSTGIIALPEEYHEDDELLVVTARKGDWFTTRILEPPEVTSLESAELDRQLISGPSVADVPDGGTDVPFGVVTVWRYVHDDSTDVIYAETTNTQRYGPSWEMHETGASTGPGAGNVFISLPAEDVSVTTFEGDPVGDGKRQFLATHPPDPRFFFGWIRAYSRPSPAGFFHPTAPHTDLPLFETTKTLGRFGEIDNPAETDDAGWHPVTPEDIEASDELEQRLEAGLEYPFKACELVTGTSCNPLLSIHDRLDFINEVLDGDPQVAEVNATPERAAPSEQTFRDVWEATVPRPFRHSHEASVVYQLPLDVSTVEENYEFGIQVEWTRWNNNSGLVSGVFSTAPLEVFFREPHNRGSVEELQLHSTDVVLRNRSLSTRWLERVSIAIGDNDHRIEVEGLELQPGETATVPSGGESFRIGDQHHVPVPEGDTLSFDATVETARGEQFTERTDLPFVES